MQASQLRPASELARALGVKALVYGDPGTGKTPALMTAPRPVLCACEPGLRSMARATNVPTWEAYTLPQVAEFFQWVFGSAETANYDTIAIDSVSQFAEMLLGAELTRWKDGRKAYGEMARTVYEQLIGLYFLKQKHLYLIAKKIMLEDGTVRKARPYFPGQELNVRVPHLFDAVLHMEKILDPSGKTANMVAAFRTVGTDTILARDRSGQLAQFEPPDLTYIFNKAMA